MQVLGPSEKVDLAQLKRHKLTLKDSKMGDQK